MSTQAANEALFRGLVSGWVRQAVDAASNFTRTQMREDGILRRVFRAVPAYPLEYWLALGVPRAELLPAEFEGATVYTAVWESGATLAELAAATWARENYAARLAVRRVGRDEYVRQRGRQRSARRHRFDGPCEWREAKALAVLTELGDVITAIAR